MEIIINGDNRDNLQRYNLKEAKKRLFDVQTQTGHLSLFLLKKKRHIKRHIYSISTDTKIYPEGIIEILYMNEEVKENEF
jgi:hypothetical protein